MAMRYDGSPPLRGASSFGANGSAALTLVPTDIFGTLKDNVSNPIANANLDFFYKLPADATFSYAGPGVTNAVGVASVLVPLQAGSTYLLDAAYNGSSIYSASRGEISYTVGGGGGPTPTQLTMSIRAVLAADGATATATVTGSLRAGALPVAGVTLQVSLDVAVAGVTTTDAAGNFSFGQSLIPLGTHTYQVVWPGNAAYAMSSQTAQFSVNVNVAVAGFSGIDPLMVVGGLAVAIVGGSAAFFLLTPQGRKMLPKSARAT